jgi:hexokinase
MTHHGGTSLRVVAVVTMHDHDDIEPDDGRDPGRMAADKRCAELACILARGLRGAIIEHRADGSPSREIQAVSRPACLDLSPDLGLTPT